ncbi:MAG: hypothetical protein J6T94_06905 [Bacteroidaceae bacterium]|nr:hypothetical protein [Bacteroidaceae bacterium]
MSFCDADGRGGERKSGCLHRQPAVYSWLQLGDMQMTKIPVIILPDMKVVIASLLIAVAGVLLLRKRR